MIDPMQPSRPEKKANMVIDCGAEGDGTGAEGDGTGRVEPPVDRWRSPRRAATALGARVFELGKRAWQFACQERERASIAGGAPVRWGHRRWTAPLSDGGLRR